MTGTPLDVRLAVGAVAAWLAVLIGLDHSAAAVLAMSCAAVFIGVALLVAASRGLSVAPALAFALFCVAFAGLPLAGRIEHAQQAPLVLLARRHATVTIDAVVDADPRVLAAPGAAGSPRVAVETSALAVTWRGAAVDADSSVLVLGDAAAWPDVVPGQQVRLDGTLSPDLGGGVLSVTLFARAPPVLLGVPPWWQRAAAKVRASLRRASGVLPQPERGLLPGLIEGDTAGLDPVLADRFRTAGLTHLLAVSGTNCSIVIGAALLVLRRLRARPWVCAVVGGLVLVSFVIVARPSPSVLRAALMATIALVSLATGRPGAGVPALSAVTLGLLVWDPTLAASASFAMSVLATGALLIVAPGFARWLRTRGVPVGIAESVAVAAAAHVVTAPVVAALSGQVSVIAVVANVLAEPVVGMTTVLGFAAAIVAPWWLGGAQVLTWLAGWGCRWLVTVAEFLGGLHGAALPWPGGYTGGLLLLLLLVVLGSIALHAGARRTLAAATVTALVIFIPVRSVTSGWPPSGWVFLVCDVGQGDALLLNAGPGSVVEIDAGPDPIAVDRCLREVDVERIPLLVFTHLHLDHVGGAAGAIRGRTIGSVLAGPSAEPASGLSIVSQLAASRGQVVRTPQVGTQLDVGAVHLDVLGPRAVFHGTRSDPNNSSLVLRAAVAGVRILLPGDAEVEAQQAELRDGTDLRADVLKVPHHGSAYSDPDYLAASHARVAVVSVGAHNDYGHPSPVLLRELSVLGIPLLRTDRDGDVALTRVHGAVTAVAHGVSATALGASTALAGAAGRHEPCPIGRCAAGTRPADGPAAPAWRLLPRVGRAATAMARRPAATQSASGRGARMAACPRLPSISKTCRLRYPVSCCLSGTRTCLSTAASARSPPLPAVSIRTSS